MVKREQEEEKARYAKMADEKRAAREKAKKERELRDASFDGEMDDVQEIVNGGEVDVNCKDANDETPVRALCFTPRTFMYTSPPPAAPRRRRRRVTSLAAAMQVKVRDVDN